MLPIFLLPNVSAPFRIPGNGVFAMPVKIPGLVIAISLLFSVAAQCDTAVKCSVKTLAACPKIGCSKPNSPLAVTNSQKRTTSSTGSPAEITFPDLKELQDDVSKTFAGGPVVIQGTTVSSYHNMKAAPRKAILSGLKAGSGKFSEGDFVELSGFIAATTGDPHPNPGESVNCKLTRDPGCSCGDDSAGSSPSERRLEYRQAKSDPGSPVAGQDRGPALF